MGAGDEDGDDHHGEDEDDNMDTEIEPALELPITSASTASNASSLLDSDEDEDMSSSSSAGSEEDSMDMEEIAMYDEPQMQSTAVEPPLSPEVDMHMPDSASPPIAAERSSVGSTTPGSLSRRNSRRLTLPSTSTSTLGAETPLVVGERLKKCFLEMNVLGVLLVSCNYCCLYSY